MRGIKVYLPDELEKKFREAAMKLFGYGRGSLSIASEKAIAYWLAQVSEVLDIAGEVEDPVGALYGMLSHVKKSGVELQHEAGELRTRRELEYRNVA
jgi:hypothetical protein